MTDKMIGGIPNRSLMFSWCTYNKVSINILYLLFTPPVSLDELFEKTNRTQNRTRNCGGDSVHSEKFQCIYTVHIQYCYENRNPGVFVLIYDCENVIYSGYTGLCFASLGTWFPIPDFTSLFLRTSLIPDWILTEQYLVSSLSVYLCICL